MKSTAFVGIVAAVIAFPGMARGKNVKYRPERERDRQGQKNGNITVVFSAEPVSDMKGCVLSVIIRDNSFFILASKRSEWKGNACAYYTRTFINGFPK